MSTKRGVARTSLAKLCHVCALPKCLACLRSNKGRLCEIDADLLIRIAGILPILPPAAILLIPGPFFDRIFDHCC
ncbi:hypothetical protein Y032_0437g1462 [Ancylostoma ceylanicum]|uniref:Uncharacterized protein n=1 Tax=Ancylostoma ceylanicum TaxID=53326 RepID=A0A016WZS0_9BILA|nr:hypothetical protein Y032_0437g1462 [Ancylostoma ceylanicum]